MKKKILFTTLVTLILSGCSNSSQPDIIEVSDYSDEEIDKAIVEHINKGIESINDEFDDNNLYDEEKDLVLNEPLEIGEYTVTFTAFEIVKDGEGNNTLLFRFDWVNNSDETISPLSSIYFEAFQNKLQIIEHAYGDNINSEDGYRQARPTGRIENVEEAFIIKDMSQPIELEMIPQNIHNTSVNRYKYTATIDLSEFSE